MLQISPPLEKAGMIKWLFPSQWGAYLLMQQTLQTYLITKVLEAVA